MNIRKLAAIPILLMASRMTLADASYQETSQITGGSMVAGLRSVSFLSKSIGNMLAPTTTTTMVHGNQKAVVSKESTEITDLDRETITHIDNLHKTYSVVTFAQMRQAFENMPKQMEQAQEKAKEQPQQPQQPKSDLKTSFDVSVKNTGVSKDISGLTAQEQLVTMQMHVTDPNAPPTDASNTVTYVVTTDAWIAPDPPEVKEVQEFDKRFGQKLMAGVDMSAWRSQMAGQNPALAQMFGGKPGSQEAMAQMAKEMAKLQGTRVLEVTRMGGTAAGTGAAQDSAQGSTPTNTTANQNPSVGGMLGSALGGSVLGGFHHKKQAPADTTTSTTPAADGSQTTSSAVLMETTMQKSNFSRESVPSTAFEVPAGFKKVETPMYGTTSK